MRIHHPVRADGKMQFIAEGRRRFRIVEWLSETAPYKVRVEYPNETGKPDSEEIRAYSIAIINTIKELLPLNPLYSEELKFFLNRFGPNEPSQLTDFAASLTTAPKQALQDVLEAFGLKKRMEKVLVLLKKELDVARLQSDIREQGRRENERAAAGVLSAPAAQGDPEGTGYRQGRQDRRTRHASTNGSPSSTCPRQAKSASTRKCTSCRCWKPVRRNTP